MPTSLGTQPTDPNYRVKQVQGVADSAFSLITRMSAKKDQEADAAREDAETMMGMIAAGTIPADSAAVQQTLAALRKHDPQRAALYSNAVDAYQGKQRKKSELDNTLGPVLAGDEEFGDLTAMERYQIRQRDAEGNNVLAEMGMFPDATKATASHQTWEQVKNLPDDDPAKMAWMSANGLRLSEDAKSMESRSQTAAETAQGQIDLGNRRAALGEAELEEKTAGRLAKGEGGGDREILNPPEDVWSAFDDVAERMPSAEVAGYRDKTMEVYTRFFDYYIRQKNSEKAAKRKASEAVQEILREKYASYQTTGR